jgi:YVTN family beta-propeller protein
VKDILNRADWIAGCAALGLFAVSTVAASAASKLYVTNSRGDDITVIDGTAFKAIHDIKVGENVHGLCTPADGARLFATVESDKSLKVIDTNTDKVVDTIPLAGEPNQCASTPDGRFVAVPEFYGDTVEIVDVSQRRIVAQLGMPHPHNCINAHDDAEMFCSSFDMHAVYRIDLKTMTYSGEIPLTGEPRPFVVTRDGRRLYAQLTMFHGFVVASVPEQKIVSRVELPPAPISTCIAEAGPSTPSHGLALTPEDKELWVTSLADDRVYDYDLATMKVSTEVHVGKCPSWVATSPDGRYVAVSNSSSDDASIIDRKSRQEIARVKVGRVPKRLLFVDVK